MEYIIKSNLQNIRDGLDDRRELAARELPEGRESMMMLIIKRSVLTQQPILLYSYTHAYKLLIYTITQAWLKLTFICSNDQQH